MSNWQYILNVKDLWEKFGDDEIEIFQVAKEFADRLLDVSNKMKGDLSPYKSEIIPLAKEISNVIYVQLMEFSKDENENSDEFDDILSDLYDICDTPLDGFFGGAKLMWIDTF